MNRPSYPTVPMSDNFYCPCKAIMGRCDMSLLHVHYIIAQNRSRSVVCAECGRLIYMMPSQRNPAKAQRMIEENVLPRMVEHFQGSHKGKAILQ